MKIAIVTGASSGMGEEFCRNLDRKGLDEIWLIARRADRLKNISETLSTHCRIIPADLTQTDSFDHIYERFQKEVMHRRGFQLNV
ncbi:MAG: SDR family NAD(P)-dependent oxidoreductase, partial [Candidatus Methanomethylophilaceae archaeon]